MRQVLAHTAVGRATASTASAGAPRLRNDRPGSSMTPEPADGRPLLKPSDIAAKFAVSRSWVYAAAEDGRLPAVRLGAPTGPLRFIEADVDRWLEESRRAWLPGSRR